jgi:signal transduction histidine kinase
LLPEIEVNVYRMAQESLNNVAKYAEAKSVEILLSTTEKELSLIVEDDGKGFDPAAANERQGGDGGLGIRGMHERAALLGGSLEIESTPGHGTSVYIRIPARFR